MKKSLGSDKNVSLILWIALIALIVCCSATFLHVYDIKKVFEDNMIKSYNGHVETAVAEIEYQVDSLKKMTDSFEANMEGVALDEDVNNVILKEELYSTGYEFYYLKGNGVLFSCDANAYRGDLYDAVAKLPGYAFNADYACLPAQGYFSDDEAVDSIFGIKRLLNEDGSYDYLLVKKDIKGALSQNTFNYLNTKGCFMLLKGDGTIIASTLTFEDYFKGESNIMSALFEKSAKTSKSSKQISEIKKNIYTKLNSSTEVDLADGEKSLVCYGQLDKTHDLYYMYYFKSGSITGSVKGAATRSFFICLFMIILLLALFLFVWITLNESNDVIGKLAYIDDVTGGYNFNYFRRNAGLIIQNNKETPFLILRFDIMNFRYINESYGHDKADIVLTATIKEFEKIFDKRKELCVRVNSDQFVALVVNDLGYEDRYMRYLKSITDDANNASIKYPIRLKVGMYKIRKEDNNIDMMIDRANAARKSIDVTSNQLSATYSDNIVSNMRKVDAIESEMSKSLRNGEFKVFIQPKWDIIKDEIIGGEALVRWIKNDGSMVYPNEFIPVFESNGFIETLDFYMLEQLCIKIKELNKEEGKYRFFPISVNQSRILINNPDYVNNVKKVIERYDTDVSLIQLEITENLFFDQKEKMIEVITALKEIGFDLAMDDFGSGYSSLNILKDIPFDILKIDKDFFDEASISKASTIILKKILEMADELGIDVICEGVENNEQVEMLKGFGCHAVQGYFYGKPMPCEEFVEKYCLVKK